jgi:DNA-binding NarL/FixJ family response regulator
MLTLMTSPRVVAAVTSDVKRRISAILRGCELRFVRAGSELVQALDEARCDLMIVEVHFNESSAAAALRCVLARGERFPVVCVREVHSDQPGYAALGALRMAAGVGAQAGVKSSRGRLRAWPTPG